MVLFQIRHIKKSQQTNDTNAFILEEKYDRRGTKKVIIQVPRPSVILINVVALN